MNVIPHAGTIRCRVVITKYGEFGTAAHCHLGNIRHQVIGNALGIFAHQAAGMGSYRIEIAQQG